MSHPLRLARLAHELDELAAVPVAIFAARLLGLFDHVRVRKLAGVSAALEQLRESGDRRRETHLAPDDVGQTRRFERDRLRDQRRRVLVWQLVADLEEAVFA